MTSWIEKPPRGPIAQAFCALCDRPAQRPDVFAYLRDHPAATPQDWGEAFLVDQFYQWRTDHPQLVEDYLAACPALAEETQLLGWLIAEEFGYREERGEAVEIEAFLARFPLLAQEARDDLRRLLASLSVPREPATPPDETRPLRAPGRDERGTHPASDPQSQEAPDEPIPEIPGYRIEAQLGRGAFGVVYRAFDLTLERAVAIKVPHRRLAATEEDIQTYLAEARRLAQLDHPGIVPVYHAGRTADGYCFMASKFIDGVDLKTHFEAGPLPFAESARIVAAVAEALHHAHLRGLVHRDIKPANILLQPSGEPCVVDFGLALHEDEQSLRRGEISGTPGYMAPEQVRGDAHCLDGRTDIWALGVVLYELLTRQRPFRGRTLQEILEQIERREPKPCRMIDERAPRELEQICLRCLQKPIADRFATARDLAEALRAAAARLTPAMAPLAGIAPLPPSPDLANSFDRACDENVQFTVFRPKSVQPARWYPLLAFAHLAERPDDAAPDEPDPLEEVQRQAARILGEQAEAYSDVRQDSGEPIPREGELTFLPTAPGVEFNPPQRTFVWRESVHREEFRLRAAAALEGQRVRGRMSVFLGSILIAEIPLAFRVEAVAPADAAPEEIDAVAARRFRRIYPAFAEADRFIVQHFETYAQALGDEYLSQCRELRSRGRIDKELRELIRRADVFQLFWSSHAMNSRLVRDECEFAISLGRNNWIRPVYWQTPLPSDPVRGLPPKELVRIEFQRLAVPRPEEAPGASDTGAAAVRDVYPSCAFDPDSQVSSGEQLPPVAQGPPPGMWRTARSSPLPRSAGFFGRLASLFSRRKEQRQEETQTSADDTSEKTPAPSRDEPPLLDQVIAAAPPKLPAKKIDEPLAPASYHSRLQRVRKPRVQMNYKIDVMGAVEHHELPLVIVAVADFSASQRAAKPTGEGSPWERPLREVDRDSLGALAAELLPGRSLEEAVRHLPAWRGLHYLVMQAETGSLLKIRVLDVRQEELLADLAAAGAPHATRLYEMLFVAGHAERTPPGLLVADFPFAPHRQDRELLVGLAQVAEAMCCPLAAELAPTWFGTERWDGAFQNLHEAMVHFGPAWQTLRAEPALRFAVMGFPKVTMSTPTGDAAAEIGPPWYVAAQAAETFARHGWFPPPEPSPGDAGSLAILLTAYAPQLYLDVPQAGAAMPLLVAARVMHNLIVQATDYFRTHDDERACQDVLRRWLAAYLVPETEPAARSAQHVLEGAEIVVRGGPRRLEAILRLPAPDLRGTLSLTLSALLPPR